MAALTGRVLGQSLNWAAGYAREQCDDVAERRRRIDRDGERIGNPGNQAADPLRHDRAGNTGIAGQMRIWVGIHPLEHGQVDRCHAVDRLARLQRVDEVQRIDLALRWIGWVEISPDVLHALLSQLWRVTGRDVDKCR